MSPQIQFLHATAHALSALGLYVPGHPAIASAVDRCEESLIRLLERMPNTVFHFLSSGAPIYDNRAIHELVAWPWTERLSNAGIQRLEFSPSCTRDSLERFLKDAHDRTTSAEPGPSADLVELTGLRYGTVAIVDPFESADEEQDAEPDEVDDASSRESVLDLTDELATMSEVLADARAGRLARPAAETIVRVLGGHLKRLELPQVTAPADNSLNPEAQAINTSLIAMAAAEAAGMVHTDRHRIGVAALLHDIGMAMLPKEFLVADSLTPEMQTLMESHTESGARFLLEHGRGPMDLAAIVAYEHHLQPGGNGYPARRFPVNPHWASSLIGTCAIYVALRSPRPYRAPWTSTRALTHLKEGAGSLFDAGAAAAVSKLVTL